MKFAKYGVTVSRMKEEEIEMVRQWRNDPVVVANYAFREYITPEMQKEWFRSISNERFLYCIIEYKGERIGVINLKNIDWETRTAETGIFIPDMRYHDTPATPIVSYMTTESLFNLFDWNTLYGHVLKGNAAVSAFVRQLGYELMPGQEEIENQQYVVTRERFDRRPQRIRNAIHALAADTEPGWCLVEPSDNDDKVILRFEEIIRKNPKILSQEITDKGRLYLFP